MRTTSRTRLSKIRLLLKHEHAHAFSTIKISEIMQLKEKMKVIFSNKRGAAEAFLDRNFLEEPVSEITNNISMCVNTSMLDVGDDTEKLVMTTETQEWSTKPF